MTKKKERGQAKIKKKKITHKKNLNLFESPIKYIDLFKTTYLYSPVNY